MKKKITQLFCAALFVLAPIVSHAQKPGIEWQKTIGGSNYEQLHAISRTADGGYIMGGGSSSPISGDKTVNTKGADDYWIVKVDNAGSIQWQKSIGGAGEDYLYNIVQTADGGYLASGYSQSDISGDKTENARGVAGRGGAKNPDIWVVRLDDTGAVLWDKTIGGTSLDYGLSMVPTFDGGCIVGGYSQSVVSGDRTAASRGGRDFWVVKLSGTGTISWDKAFGTSGDDYMNAIIQTNDTGYLIGGYANVGISGDKTDTSRGGADYWILKVDKTGAIQWQKTIGGNLDDELTCMTQTKDGGYLLGGTSESFISGEKTEDAFSVNTPDWWIVKINDTGRVEWDKTLGGEDYDVPNKLLQSTDGNYVIAGYSRSIPTSVSLGNKTDTSRGGDDYWIVKMTQAGAIKWQSAIGGSAADECYDLQQTTDGGYILGGYSQSDVSGEKTDASRGLQDYWIVKLGKDCDTAVTHLTDTFCQHSTYTLPSGRIVSAGGMYNDTLISTVTQCDSFLMVALAMTSVDTAVALVSGTFTAHATGASYQWIDCGTHQPVQGATGQTFTPTANGDYAVVVTINGCSDTSGCQTIAHVNVPEIGNDNGFSIYPNPASTEVVITNNAGINIQEISLLNVVGATVYHSNVNAAQHVINVANQPSGMYMMRIQTSNGMIVQKLQIVH